VAKKKSLTETPQLSHSAVFGLDVPPAKKAKDYLEAYRSWVYAAVSRIADQIAAMNLDLYKIKRTRTEVETEKVEEHPALALLAHVNDFTTQSQLFGLTQIYLELMGEAYWAVIREGGVITDIWPLRPDWIKIKPSKKTFVDHYIYRPDGSGKEVRLEREDVIPFRYLNPLNPYRGKGPVQAAAAPIDINDFSSQYQRAFFYNSAMPSLVFTTDQKLREQEIKRFMSNWESKFKGPQKAHQIAFLGGGLKPEPLTDSMKNLGILELREWVRDEILSVFGTSKSNLGIVDDVNRANAEANDARWLKMIIKPKMRSFTTQLNEFLLPMYEERGTHFFDFEDPVPKDQEKEIEYIKAGLEGPFLTINEVRESQSLTPVEGGDAIYMPFNMQPVGTTIDTVKGLFGKSKDKEEGVIRLELKKVPEKKKTFNVPLPQRELKELHKELREKKLKDGINIDLKKIIANVMSQKDGLKSREQDLIGKWKEIVVVTNIYEAEFFEKVTILLNQQQEMVNDNIDTLKMMKPQVLKKRAKQDELEGNVFEEDEENKRWLLLLMPFIRQIIVERGRAAFIDIGIESDLNTRDAGITDYFQNEGARFVTIVNSLTKEKISTQLNEGVLAGESIPQLKKRVEGVYADARGARAEMIARTETTRASTKATLEAWRQSNVVTSKEWWTAEDERVCPWCNSMHGKQFGIDNNFFDKGDNLNIEGRELSFDKYSVDGPPLHPSCRCMLVPVLGSKSAKPLKKETPKPISDLRKNHAKIKSMEKEEKRLETKLEALEGNIKGKYEELDQEIPELKRAILDKAKADAETEKEKIVGELRKLREKANGLIYNE